jgi:hypothetical protein
MTVDPFDQKRVPRGGGTLGIGQKYPVEVYGVPWATLGGYTTESLDAKQMDEAGFPGRGGADLIDQNGKVIPAGLILFIGLGNTEGEVVATWDEGRWWTPQESDAFTAALMDDAVRQTAEATHHFREINRKFSD